MPDRFWTDKLKNTPTTPGVYIMKDASGRIIYIGKAINLKRRIYSYFKNNSGIKETAIANTVRSINYVLAASEREALIIERQLINLYKPFFNSMWKDDKSYPYIKLTMGEDFPRLIFTRKKTGDGGEYFGPYPHVIQMKKLVRWLTRVFKLRPCKLVFTRRHMPAVSKVKSCLYFHTDKCSGPCMGKADIADYRGNARAASLFLKREYAKLRDVWKKEMSAASARLHYERAADLRDRIAAITQMGERVTVRQIMRDELEVSLRQTDALKDLKDKLDLSKWPVVIEGFDISNISGVLAVGSMVLFRNGLPEKSSYRKYRIRTVAGPDDFSMMKEVVYRRYKKLRSKHLPMPDLILIDGGKGQLSAAVQALAAAGIKNQQIASLAKRREEVFLPDKPRAVTLPDNSPARQLLERVRDEAHRFAVTYHKTRRRRQLFSNT